MKYRIELAATAKADIRQQAQWLRDQASPAAADQWLAGLYGCSRATAIDYAAFLDFLVLVPP